MYVSFKVSIMDDLRETRHGLGKSYGAKHALDTYRNMGSD